MADPMIPDAPAALTAFEQGDAQQAVDAATEDVRSECGWHVAPSLTETLTVTVARPGMRLLLLRSLHVTALTEIKDPDGAVVDPALYQWSESGIVERTSGWWRSGTYSVALTHGHASVPADLQGVILRRAARAKGDPKGNLAQQARGPFSEQYNTGGVAGFDPASDRRIVSRYRIPRSR